MRTRLASIKPFPFVLLLVATLGLLLGSAFPQRSSAANFWEIWFDIPAGASSGSTVSMNCGWHVVCVSPYTTGAGLDWQESSGNGVYFAGAAQWNGAFVQNMAWVDVTNSPSFNGSSCNNTVARVYNWYTGGSPETTQVYTHTTSSGYSHTIYAYSSPWAIRAQAGTVTWPDLGGCTATGAHIHQYLYSGATNTGGFPTASSCNANGCASYNNSTWVHYDSWVY